MRTFEERMAEINRRSTQRIRQIRRRRARVLASCVPLALLLGLGAAMTLRGHTPVTLPDQTLEITMTTGESAVPYADCIAVVTAAGNTVTQTDAERVAQIHTLLETVAANGQTAAAQAADDTRTTYTSGSPTYTIVIQLPEGTRMEYTLYGNVLKDVQAGERYSITSTQRSQLLRLLGII